MATIYTNPPTTLTAGDAFIWRESPDSGAEVTAYSFIFRSIADSDNEFTVTGVDEGETFLFTMDGIETASFDGGDFAITELVTRGADGRCVTNRGTLELFDNPVNDPTKSFNQRIVELLEAHLEGRLPEGLESSDIGGVSIEKIPISEASQLVEKYRSKVKREQDQARVKANPELSSGNTVYVHF